MKYRVVRKILKRIIPHSIKHFLISNYMNYINDKKIKNAKWVFNRQINLDGVNLIGFIRGEIGLGQSCRLIASALNSSDINFLVYNYDLISSIRQSDFSWDHKISEKNQYNVNLIHLNPPELIQAYRVFGNSIWENRYNIGYWLWELENVPNEWLPALKLVDEVWTPAEFISNNLRKYTTKPVHTLTYPMIVEPSPSIDRQYFSLPQNQFLFLTMYDCNSTMARKNPISTINAFKKSFNQNRNDVGLVIKINNPNENDIKFIKETLIGYTNIYLIAQTLTREEINSLINICDVLVSLHRAEGYGLPLAEAMTLGKPVIGTNWSANTEFMNASNSCLVDYTLVPLLQDYAMYKKGNRWAEANIDHAAEYMVKLVENKEFYTEIASNAKQYMSVHNSLEAASRAISKRVHEILDNN